MKVFKFGGASVNSTAAVRNMAKIVGEHAGERLVVVVSAMGNQGSKCPWKSCIIRSVLLKDREDGDFIDHLLGH